MADICTLWLEKLTLFLSEYSWLLDSFIIEFFTEGHWSKLPSSWRIDLDCDLECEDDRLKSLVHLILGKDHPPSCPIQKVYPLSLLAFVATCRLFSCPTSTPSGEGNDLNVAPQVDGLSHSFRRHVKPKKQHEIKQLGKVVHDLSEQVDCKNIIDIGSGQGHLARYLAFNFGLHVTTMEAVGCRLETAAKYDQEVEKDFSKKNLKGETNQTVALDGKLKHIEAVVDSDISFGELLAQVTERCDHTPFSNPSQQPKTNQSTHMEEDLAEATQASSSKEGKDKFILVGLHTCGDLAPTMLQVFAKSEQIVALASVGCCYMKLTTSSSPQEEHCHLAKLTPRDHRFEGYPMSNFLKTSPRHFLSYEARELSCHSIDSYREKLLGSLDHLRVHCYRAAVEIILRKHGLRRAQVRISKRISKLPFQMYARKLLASIAALPSPLTPSEEELDELESVVEAKWREVAVFFMLRLAMAPCVEHMILLDRKLFLIEQGYTNGSYI